MLCNDCANPVAAERMMRLGPPDLASCWTQDKHRSLIDVGHEALASCGWTSELLVRSSLTYSARPLRAIASHPGVTLSPRHVMGNPYSVPAVYDVPTLAISIFLIVITTICVFARICSRWIQKADFAVDDALSYLAYVRPHSLQRLRPGANISVER